MLYDKIRKLPKVTEIVKESITYEKKMQNS